MLKNNVLIRVNGPNAIGHTFNIINPFHAKTCCSICEAFGKIETEPIDVVGFKPIAIDLIYIFFRRSLTVIEVVSPAIWWMWTYGIKPWAIRGRTTIQGIPIHIYHGILTKGMVKYHINNNGNASTVACIYKFFKLLCRSIVFIKRHMKRRIIPPAFIAFKFKIRHKLNGINS